MRAYEPLRLFLHLSRTLHFGRTARECHVSPSALSRTIQRLERELGTALFVRDRRTVELSREGRRFQAFATEAVERWERFERSLRGEDALTGELSIFCTVTAAQSFLPDLLAHFREAHPGVHIRLETGHAADALGRLRAGADAAVAALPDVLPRGLVARTLTVTPLRFVAPVAACEVSLAVDARPVRWDAVPLVLPPVGLARDAVDRWFRRRRVVPVLYSQVASHEAILSLVSMGCGVGVVPGLVLEKSALRDRLRPVDVRPPLGDLRVGVCVQRRRLADPVLAAFWDAVAAYDQG